MVIKAYHHVYQFSVWGILKTGSILPAAYRINPQDLVGSCWDQLDFLKEMELDENGNPIGRRGVELLIQERVDEILAVSTQETDETGFFCGDFLAGDTFSVFFSTGEWGRVDETVTPNGFVFDAEDLVRRGAALRDGDLLEGYQHHIEGMAWTKARSPEGARIALKRKLSQIQKEFEVKGEQAIRELRKDPNEWRELVFPGPVDLTWATEMWENGALVSTLASTTA